MNLQEILSNTSARGASSGSKYSLLNVATFIYEKLQNGFDQDLANVLATVIKRAKNLKPSHSYKYHFVNTKSLQAYQEEFENYVPNEELKQEILEEMNNNNEE